MAKGKFIGELKANISSGNYNKIISLQNKIEEAEEKGYILTEEEEFLWFKLSDKIANQPRERGKDYGLYDNF